MNLKILAYTNPNQHHWHHVNAFVRGLESHGHNVEIVKDNIVRDCDLMIMWAHKKTRHQQAQKEKGKDYLILERGYIGDRVEWTSCGFNGLNGRADFVNQNIDDNSRSKKFKYLMQPYNRSPGHYIVIMGQIANDASVVKIGFNKWLDKTYEQLKKVSFKKIYYRPHPLDANPYIPTGLKVIKGDLHDVIKRAYVVVTLNSNSGVDSVLAGTPTITCDRGSMAYDVSDHDLNLIYSPIIKTRSEWFNKLAYCQWSMEEMADGTAWKHLRGFYD